MCILSCRPLKSFACTVASEAVAGIFKRLPAVFILRSLIFVLSQASAERAKIEDDRECFLSKSSQL